MQHKPKGLLSNSKKVKHFSWTSNNLGGEKWNLVDKKLEAILNLHTFVLGLCLKDEMTKFIAKAASHIRKMLSRVNGKLFLPYFPIALLSLFSMHDPKAFKEANVTADLIKYSKVHNFRYRNRNHFYWAGI